MKVHQTAIPDIKIIEPRVFADERGFLYESYSKRTLAALGIDADFVQDNHSRSDHGVLRGLHYQVEHSQGKLIRVLTGEVLDVSVDLRRSSPTFAQHVAVVLSAENKLMAWIPPGFAHGFLVRSEYAEVAYKATQYYSPQHERSVLWNDPALNIAWEFKSAPILSSKDRLAPPLADSELYE